MATSRSSRVTRSSVGINGLEENFCGRTLRNRSIAQQPDEGSPAPTPRARSPKKRQEGDKPQSAHGENGGSTGSSRKRGLSCSEKEESERPENCERLRPAAPPSSDRSSEGSPTLKRPKRCTRSGEPVAAGAGDEVTASATDNTSPNSPQPCSPHTNKDEQEALGVDTLASAQPTAAHSPQEQVDLPSERVGKDGEMAVGVSILGKEERLSPSLPSQPNEPHKATNGLGGVHREDAPTPDTLAPAQALSLPSTSSSSSLLSSSSSLSSSMVPSPSPGVPALVNGSQVPPDSSVPETLVPCRSLLSQQTEHVSSSAVATSSSSSTSCSLSVTQVLKESNGSDVAALCSQPPVLREPELEMVEVDVVGEEASEVVPCPVQEELAFPIQEELEPGEVVVVESQVSGTNGGLLSSGAELPDASDDEDNSGRGGDGGLSISGDTLTPLAMTTTVPASNLGTTDLEPPSFSGPHEHQYALRTSPRRATCRPSPPHRDKEESGPSPSPSLSPLPTPTSPTPNALNLESPSGFQQVEEAPPGDPVAPCRPGGQPSGLAELKVRSEAEESPMAAAKLDNSGAPHSTKDLATEEEEEEEEPDVYYFESDHLALKHNKDYQRLLQTISMLEAQRTRAIMDLEALARHQREALTNPISFVEQLQKQVELGLPCPQRVVQLPDISWDQYTAGFGDFEREFCDKKRKTRQLKLIYEKVGLPIRPKSPLDSKKESESSGLYSSLPSCDAPEQSLPISRTQMIRGRVCHQNKPDTFNQLWTVEEQRKLEELLVKFPPEEVEAKRWQKIADELGNRTAKQVASRVQKYFIKLTKAGIPVPGRTPNLCMYSKKQASSKRHHHLNKHLYRPSTFMTSYQPPVYMDDEDERSSFNSLQDPTADDSDEEGVPMEYRHLPEYKELLELKRLKKEKLHEIQVESSVVQHAGFKCDGCGMEPIQGVRWHCQDCPPDCAVDFCGNCSDCVFKTESHKPTHRLEPFYQAETFLDRDYCLPHSTGYNYLDPNYFPANR